MKLRKQASVWLISSLLFCFPNLLWAQPHEQLKSNKVSLVFEGNHFGLDLSLLSTFKAKVKTQQGSYPISSSIMPGGKIGFVYRINFNKQYSLNTGAEAAIIGRNFNLSFYKGDFSPQLKQDYLLKGTQTYVGDLILSFPIAMERRFLGDENRFLLAKAGLKVNYSTGGDIDIDDVIAENVNGEYIQVADITKYANNNAEPWVSYLASVGYGWMLKNNNIAHISLSSNISFTKYVKGTYSITIPGKPRFEGSYSSSGSYLSLTLSYVFTNANYRIRKYYDTEGLPTLRNKL